MFLMPKGVFHLKSLGRRMFIVYMSDTPGDSDPAREPTALSGIRSFHLLGTLRSSHTPGCWIAGPLYVFYRQFLFPVSTGSYIKAHRAHIRTGGEPYMDWFLIHPEMPHASSFGQFCCLPLSTLRLPLAVCSSTLYCRARCLY